MSAVSSDPSDTSSSNRPLLGPHPLPPSPPHPPHQPSPIPSPSHQGTASRRAKTTGSVSICKASVAGDSDSDGYSAAAASLQDFPILPTPKARTSRTSPRHHFQARKSARVCRPPSFLVNHYKLDQPKLLKTAKSNASAAPMLKYESVDTGSNSVITFLSGLYSGIVHPTLSASPQSWPLGPRQVLFHPTSIEGDLNFTHTKAHILCSLSSSSSSSKVTLSLFPTTHKLCLQGKIIPPWFVNQVLLQILSALYGAYTIDQLVLLEQTIANFQPSSPPPPAHKTPPKSPQEPVRFGSTDIRYRGSPKSISFTSNTEGTSSSPAPLATKAPSASSTVPPTPKLHLNPVVLLPKLTQPVTLPSPLASSTATAAMPSHSSAPSPPLQSPVVPMSLGMATTTSSSLASPLHSSSPSSIFSSPSSSFLRVLNC